MGNVLQTILDMIRQSGIISSIGTTIKHILFSVAAYIIILRLLKSLLGAAKGDPESRSQLISTIFFAVFFCTLALLLSYFFR